jgi:hydroxymethylglutaryl-CoA lyase
MDIDTGIELDRLAHAGEFICTYLNRPTRSRVAQALASKRGSSMA